MSVTRWFRAQPIVALSWIEGIAAVAGMLFDAFLLAVISPYQAILHPWSVALAAAVTLAGAIAVFSIPHRQNRRYLSVCVAIVALLAMGVMPPYGASVIVLAVILACRLSFAYGITGASVALVTGAVALGLRVFAQTSIPDFPILERMYSVSTWIVILGLIFGIIAVMTIYATSAAQTGALRERSRIALDLHDALGHGLTTLSVQLETAERLRRHDPNKADEYVQLGLMTTAAILADVRETVTMLRADDGAPARLSVLLERLCNDFSASHASRIRFSIDLTHEPGGAVGIALYRFAQEALTNIARHAQASNVDFAVTGTEKRIVVCVADDGCGFAAKTEGNGLYSMRERIASIGGNFTIESTPGEGTTVKASVPRTYPA